MASRPQGHRESARNRRLAILAAKDLHDMQARNPQAHSHKKVVWNRARLGLAGFRVHTLPLSLSQKPSISGLNPVVRNS